MSVIIAGTGTDVGKTLLSAAIMARYAQTHGLLYLKPVQTGDDSDRQTVANLTGLENEFFLLEFAHFSLPASPHYAAEAEGKTLDYEKLQVAVADHASQAKTLIELAGGLMVPLTRYRTNLDLARDLRLPIILAATTGLGTINHTVLSVQALRSAGAVLAGICFVGSDNSLYADNRRTIAEMTGAPILAELLLPAGQKLDRQGFLGLASGFDIAGQLAKFV
ncbi:MAG: dethiobiotin synthase [Spirochaetota bacterium]